MPEMSGFNCFSAVRQRFPQLSLVTMGGADETRDSIPEGATAEAFCAKGQGNPKFLLSVLSAMTLDPHSWDARR
jgi:hypothetical protein